MGVRVMDTQSRVRVLLAIIMLMVSFVLLTIPFVLYEFEGWGTARQVTYGKDIYDVSYGWRGFVQNGKAFFYSGGVNPSATRFIQASFIIVLIFTIVSIILATISTSGLKPVLQTTPLGLSALLNLLNGVIIFVIWMVWYGYFAPRLYWIEELQGNWQRNLDYPVRLGVPFILMVCANALSVISAVLMSTSVRLSGFTDEYEERLIQ
eukprot:TRINITY_DN2321_c3_g1_i1.p1 TRINITY_DN2321_c3_g1~~TRINITY_DN2321_c3_g1_i1.p1  ORF type:complete len:207 (-),score=25.46 TRINITY_DN2321_c3_g1_i1:105-725(-)